MSTIYISMQQRVQLPPNTSIHLKDIADIIADDIQQKEIEDMVIYTLSALDKSHVILDVLQVIKTIKKRYEDVEIAIIGASQTIVEILYKKKEVNLFFFALIWLLLFIGSALAIIYFHEDVSMGSVHERIYYMLTGKEVKQPLLFQVPYSIGLGLGMVLFFNHLFKNRINEEPSPLEVEMHQYQQSIDAYMIENEAVKKERYDE